MDKLNENLETYSPFIVDLFRRIKIIALIFIAFFAAGTLLSATILKKFLPYFNFSDVTLVTSTPFQLFDLALNLGMFVGLLFCIPICIYHMYAFIKSALKKGERRTFFMLIPLSTLLFLLGFVYGFFILYSTIQLLANINIGLGIKNIWDVSRFLSSIVSTSALLGLIFQFPIILSLLIKGDLVNVAYLKDKRRYAYMVMFIFTSLLPPTDGISLLLMVLPLIAMYEMTIAYNKVIPLIN
jgi:sec-independent protein translocase protein TatC